MKCAAEGCSNEVWIEGETLCGAHRPHSAEQPEEIQNPPICRWCGANHGPFCHYVKALEFSWIPGADASVLSVDEEKIAHLASQDWRRLTFISRVEFLTPRDCVVAREKEPEPEGEYPRRRPMGA